MTRENSHDTPIDSQETYEYRIVCKTCGVLGSVTLFSDDARNIPTEHDPARLHYDRTGHEAKRVNYTNAPEDIMEMLDRADRSQLDFNRLSEFIKEDD